MRPSALESLYNELELKYGYQERTLPAGYAIRPLSLQDVPAAVELENLSFPVQERSSQKDMEYRLRECPELCTGVFEQKYDWTSLEGSNLVGVTAPQSTLISETLVAMLISTKTASLTVTEACMKTPSDEGNNAGVGHMEAGRTIATHSLAVHPERQRKSLGYILLKDFIQHVYSLHTADGIAILAKKDLIPFYEMHGFIDKGESENKHGNTSWQDLYLSFDASEYEQED